MLNLPPVYVLEWPRPVGLENIIRYTKPNFDENSHDITPVILEFKDEDKANRYILDWFNDENKVVKLMD